MKVLVMKNEFLIDKKLLHNIITKKINDVNILNYYSIFSKSFDTNNFSEYINLIENINREIGSEEFFKEFVFDNYDNNKNFISNLVCCKITDKTYITQIFQTLVKCKPSNMTKKK